MKKTMLALAAAFCLAFAAAPAAADSTIEFDEIPLGTPIDGVTIGNITFHSPVASTGFGPGAITYVTDPSLLGPSALPLFLEFTTPIQDLSFGFAVDNDTDPFILDAAVVILFNDGDFVGAESFDSAALVTYNEGFADIYSTPFDGALIFFPNDGILHGAFAIDNITAIPEPTAVALLGLGAIGLVLRRRRKLAA